MFTHVIISVELHVFSAVNFLLLLYYFIKYNAHFIIFFGRICEGTRNKDGKDNLQYCSPYHCHLIKYLINFYYYQTGILKTLVVKV